MPHQRTITLILFCGFVLLLTIAISCNNEPGESSHYSDNCKTDFKGFPDIPGWNFTSVPVPTEIKRARKIYFISELHGLLFSDENDIWLTEDGSITWQHVYNGEARAFDDVTFLDSLNGFATAWYGHEGGLVKTTDGGMNWHLIKFSTRGVLFKISFVDTMIGFAFFRPKMVDGSYSKPFLAKTINGGTNWQEIPGVDVNGYSPTQLKVFSNGFGYMAGDGGKLYLTSDIGDHWIPVETGLEDIFWNQAINADTMYASSYDSFLKSTNGGVTWHEISKYFVETGHFFSGSDGITVQRVASDLLYDVFEDCNAFLTTSDGGETWIEGPPSYYFSVSQINFINHKTGFLLFKNEIFRIHRD